MLNSNWGGRRPKAGRHREKTVLPSRFAASLLSLLRTIGLDDRPDSLVSKLVAEDVDNRGLNEETAYGLLGRFQPVIIESIEPIDSASITEEEEKLIRGPNALIGNAPIYGMWLVTWRPERYADVQRYPHSWKVMVVKSIAPNTGTPAFMTAPARGSVPTYVDL